MVPSRRIYELIGFNFSPSKNSAYYVATMPAGWRVVNSGINCKLYIVDAKGFRRGEKIWDFHNPNFTLLTRYINTYHHLSPNTIQVIIKNMERDKYAGIIHKELNLLSEEFKRYKDRWDKLSRSIETVSRDVKDIHNTTDKITKRFDSINQVEIKNNERIDYNDYE